MVKFKEVQVVFKFSFFEGNPASHIRQTIEKFQELNNLFKWNKF